MSALRTLQQIADHITGQNAGVAPAAPAAPVAAKAAPATSGPAQGQIAQALLAVVAEKTGYQAAMLDLSMDLESDLGVDSIKRVEILYGIQERLPGLQELKPEALSALRTLQQIADHITGQNAGVAPAAPAAPVAAKAAPATSGPAQGQIAQALLAVVAEKTGYQAAMLDLSMDLESDLGVDSIKRVEILYGIQERLPGLQELKPEALSALRTLQQIADHITGQNAGSAPAAPATPVVSKAAAAGPAQGQIAQALLAVVAEKTGYQAEMLDLSMELEADLGIDSIKRVEILYGLSERMPDLGELNPEQLAEHKSLQAILDHLVAKKKSPKLASSPVTTRLPQVGRLEVGLQPLSPPDRLQVSFPAGHQLLVAGDPELVQSLGSTFKELGITQVTALVLPGLRAPKNTGHLHLPSLTEADLATTLAQVRAQGPIGGFLYLHPQIGGSNWFEDQERGLVQSVFFLAKHLKNDLTQAAQSGRALFVALTRLDGALGLGGKGKFGVQAGGLAGLTKTLKIEWPEVFCRWVDIALGQPVQEILEAELLDANLTLSEVGWRKNERVTLRAKPQGFGGQTQSIGKKEVFVVSGGAKGVTAACVLGLAQVSKATFLLLGRSPLEPEPSWAAGTTDLQSLKTQAQAAMVAAGEKPTPVKIGAKVSAVLGQREIARNLEAIKALGAKAVYLSCDVTNPKAVAASLKKAGLGPVTGLIHGAGVLADKKIENKTFEDFERVYGTKVDGLAGLLGALDPQALKYLVLFSSSAGFYGNLGQSDYAAANEVLNKTAWAFHARYPQARVLSMNWGPWEGGMVNESLKKLFESRGVEVIPVAEGVAALVHELSVPGGPIQLVIGSSMVLPEPLSGGPKKFELQCQLDPKQLPLLEDHQIAGEWVLPMTFGLHWMAQKAANLYPGYKITGLTQAKVLKGIKLAQAQDFTLVLEETKKTDHQVTLKAQLSGPGAKLPVLYDSLQIDLDTQAPVAPRQSPPTGSGKAVQYYQDGTLFHGPGFQGIVGLVSQTKEKLVLACRLEEPQGLGPFEPGQLNPLAEDLGLQGMLVQARFLTGNASLPLSLGALHPFGAIPFGQNFYLELEVVSFEPNRLVANLTQLDEQGRVKSKTQGAEVTISANLNAKFKA